MILQIEYRECEFIQEMLEGIKDNLEDRSGFTAMGSHVITNVKILKEIKEKINLNIKNIRYRVLLNDKLNLATSDIKTAKSRAYDLMIKNHKNVKLKMVSQ